MEEGVAWFAPDLGGGVKVDRIGRKVLVEQVDRRALGKWKRGLKLGKKAKKDSKKVQEVCESESKM